jgi:hypothetical protein
MNKTLTAMPTLQLVELYQELALRQDRAMLDREQGKVSDLVKRRFAIEAELKSRPGDQRHALFALYSHPNPQVRLSAATATLALAPAEARAALQLIIDRREFPQAGDAGMRLWNLDRGVFVPT